MITGRPSNGVTSTLKRRITTARLLTRGPPDSSMGHQFEVRPACRHSSPPKRAQGLPGYGLVIGTPLNSCLTTRSPRRYISAMTIETAWASLRVPLKTLTFSQMKDVVSQAGFPMKSLHRVVQTTLEGKPASTKSRLMDEIDAIFFGAPESQQHKIALKVSEILLSEDTSYSISSDSQRDVRVGIAALDSTSEAAEPDHEFNYQSSLQTTGPSMTGLVAFVSHAGDDRKFVKPFVDKIIRQACGLNVDEVRYTSTGSQGLDAGGNLTHSLQSDLRKADFIVTVLSPKFLVSSYCMAELGAAWGRGLHASGKPVLFPVLCPNIDREEVFATAEFLRGTHTPSIEDKTQLLNLVDRVALATQRSKPVAEVNEAMDDWLELVADLAVHLQKPGANKEVATLQADNSRMSAEIAELRALLADKDEKLGLAEFKVDLGILNNNASTQGWLLRNQASKLVVTSPTGSREFHYSYAGQDYREARSRLRDFVGTLRAHGLRVNEGLHSPLV